MQKAKRIFVFFCVFLIFVVSGCSIVVSAATVETEIFTISAGQMYSFLLDYSSYFTTLSLDDGVLSFVVKDDYPEVRLNTASIVGFNPDTTLNYKLVYSGTGVTIQTIDTNRVTVNHETNVVEITNLYRLFLIFGRSGSYNYFTELKIETVPDPPTPPGPGPSGSGDISDMNPIFSFITSAASQFWVVLSSCWWAMAFVCLPLVYFLFVIVSNLFSFDFSSKKFTFSKKIKSFIFNIQSKKYAKSLFKTYNQLGMNVDYITIDGKKFLNPKKLHGHFLRVHERKNNGLYFHFNDKERFADMND